MRTRSLTLAAVALAVAAAGCGSKNCNDQTPPVAGAQNCTAVAGSPVTMQVRVCPKCDQGAPECLVHLDNVGSFQISLEPVAPVCDANASCPIVDPSTCLFAPLNCTFTAPAALGPYNVVVVTPEGATQRTLTVVASGPSSCGF